MDGYNMAKSSLFDLYKTGKKITLGEGDVTAEVYIQKMNAIQQQKAQRKANAARSAVLALQRNPDAPERAEYDGGILDQFETHESRIEFLVASELQDTRSKVEAEISAQDEWKKDDYLEGLQEAWSDGMSHEWADTTTRTEESERVYAELRRFMDQVSEAMKKPQERARREFSGMPDEEVYKLVMDKQLRAEADIAWLNEYRMQEVLYSTRQPYDKHTMYFDRRADLDGLEAQVLNELIEAIKNLTVDIAEGKESQESQDS